MREYHVPGEYSLYDFKRFIENDLDFDDSQHGAFFLLDDKNKKTECYSLFDSGSGTMDSVILEDLSSKKQMTKLLYTFDFFNNRSLLIEFMGETEAMPRTNYPAVALSKGDPPGQFAENLPEDELPDISTEYADDCYDGDDDDEM